MQKKSTNNNAPSSQLRMGRCHILYDYDAKRVWSLGFGIERRVVDVDQVILDLAIDHVEDVRKWNG